MAPRLLSHPWGANTMLSWALAFLIIAIAAAIFGFTGIAVAATGIAKLLFFVFLVIFLLTMFMRYARRAP